MTNLFFFTGSETYFLRQKANGWREAFREKHGDINLLTLDGAEEPIGRIMADIEAAPFLSEKRLIFIENLPESSGRASTSEKTTKKDEKRSEDLKKLVESLKEVPKSSVVVFIQPEPDKRRSFYKNLIKIATVEEFKPLPGASLSKWIRAAVMKEGGTIDDGAIEYLISMTDQDCWRLSQEVKKLTSFKYYQPITKEDVDSVVTPTVEANIFHFTDALSTKNHRKAIRSLHRSMVAGENLRQLFYMIVRQFRLLLQVKDYKKQYPTANPTSIASSLKLHPFVARNVLNQISHFDFSELKKAYEKLLEIDTDLKTSRIRITAEDQDELALAIERFILIFCC
ncbi:DNA polymerase III subunit delta [Candidatus Peregrinibacteria bacterium CG_4_10_14_0_2_um_filter_43_11]|nr:MAG: DNA polymerase III subunit delta [Candidatus Peregrinibacteria bacterium CG_4_10_14_0_2_um_filter_43_11]